MKTFAIAAFLFILGAGGAYTALYLERHRPAEALSAAVSGEAATKAAGEAPAEAAAASEENAPQGPCDKHALEACPFCDVSQVVKLGECPGHKVPEALCHRCRPALVPAFKIEGDWCGGHDVPESQCQLCDHG